jgi:anhydro-N-acetylmuramic acid kinase
MRALADRMAPIPVQPLSRVASSLGIDADNKEAVAFAVLAVQALHAAPGNLPSVTGASGRAILGKICMPPWPAA